MWFAALFLRGGDGEFVRPSFHRNLEQRLPVRGSVMARSSESHFSPIQGEAAKVLELAEEGTIVSEGDVICRIDSFAVAEKLNDKRLERERIAAELKGKNVGMDLSVSNARREATSLLSQLEGARRDLEGYQHIESGLKELELQNALVEAENDAAEKLQKVADVEELLAKGYASAAEQERAQRELKGAESRYEEARLRHRFFTEVQQEQELLDRRRAVADLEDAVETARDAAAAEISLTRTAIATLEAEMAECESRIAELERQLEGCTVRAGADGIVVHGVVYDKTTGRRKVEVGDLVWSNVVLVQVTDLSRVDLEVWIPEEQMHDLAEGLEATVWTTAEPLQGFAGPVRSIGTMTTGEQSMGGGQPSVAVRIGIDDPPPWIRPGMTGKAEVLTKKLRDVLVVPFSSVAFEGDRAWVFKRHLFGARRHETEVLGMVDEGVVVGAGLSEHDRILLEAPLE